MKILLSAYACEPNKGSEPGVGWKWVEGLAECVELSVITRANNRASIEREISARSDDDKIRHVVFEYYDLPPIFRRMKKAKFLPTLLYYFLWQWAISKRFASKANSSDIVHHLTFCTALCPGFWNKAKANLVIGPVAAPLVPCSYLSLFGRSRWIQALRNHLIRNFLKLPWLKKTFTSSKAVFPANTDMKNLLTSMGVNSEDVMLDTGAPAQISYVNRHPEHSTCQFLYAGVLERRKGLELALRAFAKAMQSVDAPEMRFAILGDGPDKVRLMSIAANLGIGNEVFFLGAVPQVEVARHFSDSDVFVFTSIRDTSGGVNLEAMTAGLPVLCLAHQGVGDVTDDDCAIRIPVGNIQSTVDKLSSAMLDLAHNPSLRLRLGAHARSRAIEYFSWQEKFSRMFQTYQRLMNTKNRSND